jgi:hypothetical protein
VITYCTMHGKRKHTIVMPIILQIATNRREVMGDTQGGRRPNTNPLLCGRTGILIDTRETGAGAECLPLAAPSRLGESVDCHEGTSYIRTVPAVCHHGNAVAALRLKFGFIIRRITRSTPRSHPSTFRACPAHYTHIDLSVKDFQFST